jgi:hypothetical protein
MICKMVGIIYTVQWSLLTIGSKKKNRARDSCNDGKRAIYDVKSFNADDYRRHVGAFIIVLLQKILHRKQIFRLIYRISDVHTRCCSIFWGLLQLYMPWFLKNVMYNKDDMTRDREMYRSLDLVHFWMGNPDEFWIIISYVKRNRYFKIWILKDQCKYGIEFKSKS